MSEFLKSPKSVTPFPLTKTSKYDFLEPTICPSKGGFWKKGEWGEFIVSSFSNMDSFSLQNTSDELEMLVDRMTVFYDEARHRKVFGVKEVKMGGYYAAYYANPQKWYRVKVEDVVHIDKVTEYVVRSLDSGDFAMVTKENIFPLKVMDVALPIQSVQARLHSSKPNPRDFTMVEHSKFRHRLDKRKLKTYVVDMVSENEIPPKLSVIFKMIAENRQMKKMTKEDFFKN